MKINHIGLGTTEVLATAEMFEKYFGLSRLPGPSDTQMAFLVDDDGSLLTMFKTNDAVYPKLFHIGFMLDEVEQVSAMHQRLAADGFEPEETREEYGRFTFYFKAPGGFVVEVNSFIKETPHEIRDAISAKSQS